MGGIWLISIFYRSISAAYCGENGEDGVGYWAGLWVGTGCGGCDEREEAGICGVY
jgi:hypothetical protein